jgi:transposase
MKSVKKINHIGKVVFVGIDVHKRTYTISAGGEHMPVDKVSRLPGDPKKLAKFLKNRYPGAILNTCYEAGFSGFALFTVFWTKKISITLLLMLHRLK